VALPKLLATFVEDGQAWGLFVESGGSQRVRAVAGAVDGFTIVSIAPGRATVEKAGQTYELEIPRPNSEPAPRMTTRRN
jgi:hypothetical protein